MRKLHSLFIALFLLYFFPLLSQQEPFEPLKTSSQVVIDAALSEDVWKDATVIKDFVSYQPDFGKEMPFESEARMAYDSDNLYFSFRCYDPEPDKLKASIDARDNIFSDDWICINLDSFNDQQSLYAFYVNPHGIQMDSKFSAGNEDHSLDFIWYSTGLIDSLGYLVEIQIPLKSIRFSSAEPVKMGVILERRISRLSLQGTYPALDPEQDMSFTTQMMPIQYREVNRHKLLEILPAVTYQFAQEQLDGAMENTINKPDIGLSVKYGITPDLTVDATLNPDFSQIEADAGQIDINLRYNLLYPEKRSFFQEGSENYKVGASSSATIDPVRLLVNTRSIVNPTFGSKISGKIGSKNTISALYASDQLDPEAGIFESSGVHNSIVRYKRTLNQAAFVGGIYTNRLSAEESNHVGGFDGQLRLNKSTMFEYHLLGSSIQTDATETGFAAGGYLHSERRNIDYAVSLKSISEGFMSSSGYITRTGLSYVNGLVKPKLYPDSELFRKIEIELSSGVLYDNIYDDIEGANHLSVQSLIGTTSIAKLKYSYSTEIFLGEKFKTGGLHFMLTSRLSKAFSVGFLLRNIGKIYYDEAPFQGHGNSLIAEFTVLPTKKLHFDVSVLYQDFYDARDGEKVYDYLITRSKLTYQMSKYLFFRGIVEHNSYRQEIIGDFLASFTYIPGTVLHVGYGSLFDNVRWDGTEYTDHSGYMEMNRGLFIKASYLHRF